MSKQTFSREALWLLVAAALLVAFIRSPFVGPVLRFVRNDPRRTEQQLIDGLPLKREPVRNISPERRGP